MRCGFGVEKLDVVATMPASSRSLCVCACLVTASLLSGITCLHLRPCIGYRLRDGIRAGLGQGLRKVCNSGELVHLLSRGRQWRTTQHQLVCRDTGEPCGPVCDTNMHTTVSRYTVQCAKYTDTQTHTPTHSHSGGTEQHQQGSHSPCVLEQRQCAIKVTGLDECLRELLH